MHRGFQILGLGLALAVLAYACVYLAGTARSRELLRSPQPELAWLQAEFHLSDAELAHITQLHEAYLPKCAVHCRRIAELNEQLATAVAGAKGVTPEITALLAERSRERTACQAEMLQHFFEVSQTMPPKEGERYLAWVQQTCLDEPMMANHAAMTGMNQP